MSAEHDNDALVQACLSGRFDVESVQVLPTLPHSLVARVGVAAGRSVIFKLSRLEAFHEGLRREQAIDEAVFRRFQEPVAPKLVAQGHTDGAPWVVFEDLSPAYAHLPRGQVPTDRQMEAFVGTLARLHVQSARLDLDPAFSSIAGRRRITDESHAGVALLDQFLAEQDFSLLPDGSMEVARAIRQRLPELIARLEPMCTSMIHGDAHLGNAMFGPADVRIVDWAMAAIGPGEVDLAHALALNLPREAIGAIEKRLVHHYARCCSDLGMPGEAAVVWQRYVLCLNMTVMVSIVMGFVPGLADDVVLALRRNAFAAAIQHAAPSAID